MYPQLRLRRLRQNSAIRSLVRETQLPISSLIQPLFIASSIEMRAVNSSLPGLNRISVDQVVTECTKIADLGIPAVLLFGIPEFKDDLGLSACMETGPVQRAIRALKEALPELLVITDLCFCEYTSHGHCGVIGSPKPGKPVTLLNDETLELLCKQAISHAEAGADIIAPSGMLDGCVSRLRRSLDQGGFSEISIMSYAVKYASALYGPFREAAGTAIIEGDRKTHQMDPANHREALREATLDCLEGADILMIKPALFYLDIIQTIRQRFDLPIAAYSVSGEYAMIKVASERGLIDGDRAMVEMLLSISRAGADMIITYFATEYATKLKLGDFDRLS